METSIHEQFVGVERASSSSKKLIEMELKRRGLDTLGVKEKIDVSWLKFCSSEKQFTEITEIPLSPTGRSALTTPSTFNLYSTYFDESTELTTPDLIYLSGEKTEKTWPTPLELEPEKAASFVKKADCLGVAVRPRQGYDGSSGSSLFPIYLRKWVPQGFEQINDDLFCRKSNQFFVLNGPAVDTWHYESGEPRPITKVFQTEDVYFSE